MKTKIKILFFILALVIVMIIPTYSNAALQANGGEGAKKKIDVWMQEIRQMEAAGGTLGFSETIDTTSTTDRFLPTSASNGLDCHMEKSTEYGALVILSASSYGNPSKITSGGTTTGNVTGVKMNINKEFVAAGFGLDVTNSAKYASARYLNNDYDAQGVYHRGDAMDIGTWHGGTSVSWATTHNDAAVFRAYEGSVFSYNCFWGNASANGSTYTRAVVVIGTGL